MSESYTDAPHQQLYPRRYWTASPAFGKWNKVTIHDIHSSLRTFPGFEGQNVFFYRNHPIQYVQIIGIVVGIEVKAEGRYVFLTLDDGSRAVLEVKIDVRMDTAGVEYPSNTTVDEVDVRKDFDEISVSIRGDPINLGTAIKAKGSLSKFRDKMQMNLKRVSVIGSTNDEAAFWAETARWKRDVLSRPWEMTDKERAAVDDEISMEQRKQKAKAAMRTKRKGERVKHEEELKLKVQKREEQRRRREIKFNEGALRGSSVIRAPWEP